MRIFNYRSPRFRSGAELSFHTEGEIVQGVCTNVSQEGLLATFDKGRQEVGTCGSVILRYGGRQFTLGAVVTHREDKQVGLSFLRRTQDERTASEQFAVFLGKEAKASAMQSAG